MKYLMKNVQTKVCNFIKLKSEKNIKIFIFNDQISDPLGSNSLNIVYHSTLPV